MIWIITSTLLFLGGWVTSILAYPLGAILIGCCYNSWKLISTIPSKSSNPLIHITLFGILAFLCSFFTGLTGHFPQHILDLAQRNAVYGNLCQSDWPIVLPDGRYFVYYFAAFLPPALISKLTGYEYAPVILMLWNALALFIAFSLIYFRTSKASIAWLGILIICFLSDPTPLLRIFSPGIKALLGIQVNMGAQAHNLLSSIQATINHTPGILLITTILFNKRIHHSLLPILGATCLSISVFGAISILPFLTYRYLKAHEQQSFQQTLLHAVRSFFCSWTGICSLFIVSITLLYHKCSNGDIIICPMFFVTHGLPIPYIIAKNIVHTFLIVGTCILPLIWLRKQYKGFFWLLLSSLLFVNFIFIGNGGPNELAFKGNTALLIISAFGWMHTLEHGPRLYKCFAWLLLIPLIFWNTHTIIIPRIKNYGKTEQNINNPFNGHLYHPGSLLDQSVPPSVAPIIPHVLYTKAGESRRIFPFSALPPENKELYTLPASYRKNNIFLKKTPSNSSLHILFFEKS